MTEASVRLRTRLTTREARLAATVARERDDQGCAAGADAHKFGNLRQTYSLHLDGCLGEMAFAKMTNCYWSGAGDAYEDDSDVLHYQVRATRHAHGCLIIRPDEAHLHDPWVLVVAEDDDLAFRFAGWCWGREGRDERWKTSKNTGRPWAYFVPQHALRAPWTLPAREGA